MLTAQHANTNTPTHTSQADDARRVCVDTLQLPKDTNLLSPTAAHSPVFSQCACARVSVCVRDKVSLHNMVSMTMN